jgi:hypothetical protein
MDTLFGSSKDTTVQQLPEQLKDIQDTSKFKFGTALPGFKSAMEEGQNVYRSSLPGVNAAAQNLGGTAGQVQQTTGEIGESLARTGATGLQSLFGKDYEQNQIMSALAPAQGQYMQNIASQGAQFGGAGQLGSARQALAGQQMAGSNAMNQAQIAAQVQKDIAGQRADVGKYMTGQGFAGLNQALGAAGTNVQASQIPQDYALKYMQGQYGLPAQSYTAPYPGTQSTSQSSSPSLFDIGAKILPFLPFSDSRLKENIKFKESVDGVNVYSYNYKWETKSRIGPMAQELLGTKYESAVHPHASGYYTVDYNKLPGKIQKMAEVI